MDASVYVIHTIGELDELQPAWREGVAAPG
jgi:hypothetical protein